MIVLENIQKIYPNGFCALEDVSLKIAKGDIFGIIGYSGAGKSTLVRLINRLEEPSGGSVIVDGEDMLALSKKELQERRQKIGMIFQHFNLLSSKNVFENIAYALKIAKWDKDKIRPRVQELLELVGLSDKASFYPSQLSGGQKQRVAIARALANHPKILLCDEATSALDTQSTASILELLRSIQKRLKITIVMITHQIEVIKSICNKICVMDRGKVVEKGLVQNIFLNPKSKVTKELIAHLPEYDCKEILPHITDSAHTYELTFLDGNQNEPIISQAIKKFDIDVNILFADFNNLSKKSLGRMIIEIRGDQKALEWIRSHNVEVKSFLNPTQKDEK